MEGARRHHADHLPCGHPLTLGHRGAYRFVGGAQRRGAGPGHLDHQHPTARDRTHEAHPPRARRPDPLARARREIDPAMPRRPGSRRRLPAPQHGRPHRAGHTVDRPRPLPARPRPRRASLSRTGRHGRRRYPAGIRHPARTRPPVRTRHSPQSRHPARTRHPVRTRRRARVRRRGPRRRKRHRRKRRRRLRQHRQHRQRQNHQGKSPPHHKPSHVLHDDPATRDGWIMDGIGGLLTGCG
ncbi:hypothetical protein SHXM_07172 [Streptomyces hygroscopicus]|nr:hypothetical protein SHXM_07172 [Streptomyces hygroscopicus]